MAEINLSDEQLADQVQQGKVTAFNELVGRYEQKILRYTRRLIQNHHDAEDITQDTFLKAFQNIKSFDLNARWSPWLYRIAHNLSLNHLKRLSYLPLPFFDPDVLFPHPLAPNDQQTDLINNQLKKDLEKSLNQLKPKYREVIIMRYLEDMSYRTIADILKVPVGTISIRLKRALVELKKHYPSTNYE